MWFVKLIVVFTFLLGAVATWMNIDDAFSFTTGWKQVRKVAANGILLLVFVYVVLLAAQVLDVPAWLK